MKLYTISNGGREEVALQCSDGRLYPVTALGLPYRDMNHLIENVTETEFLRLQELSRSIPLTESAAFAQKEVRICSPIPVPRQDIICLGVNYDEHLQEAAEAAAIAGRDATVYFSKHAARISGDGDPIPAYDFVDSLDYEVELAVILGHTAKDVSSQEAADCIFGYSVFNDISARNLQFRHQQWYRGKSLDGYSIMGRCIVTADEIRDVQRLDITCLVNGQLRQSSNTACMIQPVCEAISELSQGMTLKAGTIIATGTPGGVGLGMDPPRYLMPGDTVTCCIQGIGTITNPVV